MNVNETLDFFWIIGMILCVVWVVLYAKDLVILKKKKKNCAAVTGTARTCKMQKNWAYTGLEVRYDYEVNGEDYNNVVVVKGTFNPKIERGNKLTVYYDEQNPKDSFLENQISMSIKNILVLAGIIVLFGATYFWGR